MLRKTKHKVLIYNSLCEPLRVRVDVDLFEDGGCEYLDWGHTARLSGEKTFGVELKVPVTSRSITVIVTDDDMRYSGNCYLNLNGSIPTRLDLILWTLPNNGRGFGGGGLGGPGDPSPYPPLYDAVQAAQFRLSRKGQTRRGPAESNERQGAVTDAYSRIQQQNGWSDNEKKAVETLLSSYIAFIVPNLLSPEKHTARFVRVRDLWAATLARCGVSVASIIQSEKQVPGLAISQSMTKETVF
jgi:hypothetical protein